MINHTQYDVFDLSDSTWKFPNEVPMTYDINNRILELGDHDWNLFYYNSSGNIDSLCFLYGGSGGYLADRATLVDAYGNEINLVNYSGRYTFFYSDFITGKDEETNIDMSFCLSQNYPNPFNPETKIKYAVPKSVLVKIKVYNLLGQEITTLVNEEKQMGNYEVVFNGSNLSSGVYFYKMNAGNYFQTKKFLLLK